MTEDRYQYLNSLSLEDYDRETTFSEQKEFIEYQREHHPNDTLYLQTFND